ncbi:MAG TPA: hypothetical protein VH253_19235 [Phycisphaerae bacterium]|nr:hypothetical protein [Phycisphaerae bacterium]
MATTIISGTPKEVAEKIATLRYEKVEAIVLPCVSNGQAGGSPIVGPEDDIFAEMTAFAANAPDADDSRHAIYTRKPGE